MNLETNHQSLESIIKKHITVDVSATSTCFSLLSTGDKIDNACAEGLAIYGLSEVFHAHSHWIAVTTKNVTQTGMKTLVHLLDKMFQKTDDDSISGT